MAYSAYIFKAFGVASAWGLCGMHPGTAVNSDGQRAKLKPHKITEDEIVLPQSLFWSTRTRDSTPADANNSVLRKIHQGVEYFDELEASARIFTSHEKPSGSRRF